MPQDRLWTNGRIMTLDAGGRVVSDLYTRGERVEAVGNNLREQFGASPGVEVVDLDGGTVVPGLMDCHVHFTTTGLGLVEPRYDQAASLADMKEKLREDVRDLPEEQFYRGWQWDQSHYPESRGPTKQDLDEVAPHLPIMLLRIGGNVAALNSKALALLDLSPDLPGIERTSAGEATGVLRGEANFFAQMWMHERLTPEERSAAHRAMGALAASRGVTTVHAVEGEAGRLGWGDQPHPNADVSAMVAHPPEIPLDIVIWDTQVINLPADLQRIQSLGLPRAGGDIFGDGVLGIAWVPGGNRAAISEPYLDGGKGLGHLLLDDALLTEFLTLCLEMDLQVGHHAVGDRAIGQFLNCFEAALKKVPRRDARPRIEHGILPTDEQIARAADLSVVFSTQPAFEWQSGGPDGRYAQRLGPKRVRRTHPLRQLTDAGVLVAGGSDSPANVPDPLLGMHGCVYHASEENRLSPVEALSVFTTNGARSVFEENVKGTIEAGKQADFVVLAQDPTEAGVSIKDIQVLRTVHRGRDSYVIPAEGRPEAGWHE